VDEDASSDDFKFLVILDEAGAFSAAIDARSAADLLASDDGQTFITAINDGSLNRETGMQYSELMFDALPDSATNIEALQEMGRRNLDALVVVYGDNRIKGILSREQVVSSMMLALVNSSTENGE
jgi:Trk K+ transport system NAD-binding subunit